MKKQIKTAILGTGSRGSGYGMIMNSHPDQYTLTAACDIDPEQLRKAKGLLGLTDDMLFSDEESFFAEKRGDLLVIATCDKDHVRQCVRAMRLGYDVLLEKPVSDSREELAELLMVQEETGRVVAVCHELRYGYGYEKLSELLSDGAVGELIAIDAMERVAYWHQAQAYVRIQYDHRDVACPTILAKCSHDLDLIQHYAGSECGTVTSIGGLGFFRTENAPEGSAERCLDCRFAETCVYSAKKIYIDGWRKKGCPEFVWPYNKVSLIKPNTEERLYEGLRKNCFGRCVFRCGFEQDPGVVDHQLVQMNFTNGVTAVLKMVFAAEPGRRINLFGSTGEILMDERLGTIEVMPYGGEKRTIDLNVSDGHGGGDPKLIDNLYRILSGEGANRTSLRESIECHLIGIAAEESRHSGGALVKVHG